MVAFHIEPLVKTPNQAREYLWDHPEIWPFVVPAVMGFVGVGSAAKAYGLDEESFARVCTAANERMGAVKEQVQTGRKVDVRPDLLLV